MAETRTIAARFRGPPQSGNGGYTAGLLAESIEGPAEVTLRAPPPLDTPLGLVPSGAGGVELRHGSTLVAEALSKPFELELPAPVSLEAAQQASRGYPGFERHPLPGCFVCGTERAPGDGLRLFAGAVGSRPLVAAPWVPQADLSGDGSSVDTRFVWAALDCPSWFGFVAFNPDAPMVLLGRLSASIARRPRVAEPCVVTGWALGRQGRRIECASALFDADGRCLAHSRSTWIALKSDTAW